MTIAQIRRAASIAATFAMFAVWGAGLAAALSACTPAQRTRAVVDGQLFCGVATNAGPLVVALIDAALGGAPVIVTGMTARAVAAACAVVNGIPVIPPPDPAAAPVVAALVPKS